LSFGSSTSALIRVLYRGSSILATTDMETQERPAKVRRLSNSTDVASSAPFLDNPSSLSEHPPTQNGDNVNEPPSESNDTSEGNKPQEGDILAIKANLEGTSEQLQTSSQPLSKNALKKLRKRQEWEAGREERKVKRRERHKEKKERQRETKKEQAAAGIVPAPIPVRPQATTLPITFILDCGFDDLMKEKERISLSSQLTRCYADNARAPYRAHIALSSFGGWMKDRFEGLLRGHYKNWKGVRTYGEGFAEVAQKASVLMAGPRGGQLRGALSDSQVTPEEGEVVYLTADTEETLTELKPYSTYIIGGIVDKNRHKGLCYKRAKEAGIRTAKLPIGEYIEMSHRAVLTTNQVNEIMLRWLEYKHWGEAFMKAIPSRKGGKLKASTEAEGNDAEDDDTDDGAALEETEDASGMSGQPEEVDETDKVEVEGDRRHGSVSDVAGGTAQILDEPAIRDDTVEQ
jgi:tRNA (guanine9-N1)-methyltransferase